jgi:putative tricarboxylic transport membrane protein
VATTFDGYPHGAAGPGRRRRSRRPSPRRFVGALFAVVLITFLAPLVAQFALKFGPPEFFAVQLLTFCSFVGMSKEPACKTHRRDDAGLRAGAPWAWTRSPASCA